MKAAAVTLSVLALTIGMVLAWQSLDPVQRERRETAAYLEAERGRLALDRERSYAAVSGPVSTAFTWLLLALAATTLVLLLTALVDAYRRRCAALLADHQLVFPNAQGNLPVPRVALQRGDLVDVATQLAVLAREVEALRAIHTPGQSPVQATYSPHVTLTQPAVAPATPLGAAPEQPSLPLPGPLDLADLAHTPSIDRILLALGPGGQPLVVPIGKTCHIALAGPTGAGKSNIGRLVLAQLLAVGARVCIADPHYADFDPESGDDWTPIRRRLHLAPAVRPTEIADLLAFFTSELEQRLAQRRAAQPGERFRFPPLFLYLDEYAHIVRDNKALAAQVKGLVEGGRKVALLLVTSTQDWLVETLGKGSGGARENFRTAYYLGGDPTTGRVLLDLPPKAIDDGALGAGVAYLRSAASSPAQLVRVPLASNRALTQLLGDGPGTSSGTSAAPAAEAPVPGQQDAPNGRSARVRTLLAQRRGVNEILAEVWGIDLEKKGRPYRTALDEYQAIVAQIVGGAAHR